MKFRCSLSVELKCLLAFFCLISSRAFALSDGYADLMVRDSTLTGAGVDIAQVEALNNATPQRFEVNPSQTSASVTYFKDTAPYPTGTTTPTYTNPNLYSNHSNSVADEIFDTLLGFAPDVSSVQNFERFYYYNNIINSSVDTSVFVINQSFVFIAVDGLGNPVFEPIPSYDQNYDNYADQYNVLFCNGTFTNSNPAPILTPASSYNGLAVGIINGAVITLADGRSKPDLVSFAYGNNNNFASFTTARVSAFASILFQAGARGDGGIGVVTEATDAKTVKALLLNGADKPVNWAKIIDYDNDTLPVTHTSPLDASNGAGAANINFAHLNLQGGLHVATETRSLSAGGLHSPSGAAGNVSSKIGWNLAGISTSAIGGGRDGVHDYYFDWTPGEGQAFDLTTTVTWNRQSGKSGINNLDLYVYREDGLSYNLVAASESSVDNVEHLHILDVPAGRYVIQVVSRRSGVVAALEEYALAFRMEAVEPPAVPTNFSATVISDTQIDLAWTDNATDEDGYRLERSLQSDFSVIDQTFDLAANSVYYADTGLSAGVVYYYRLVAYNAGGDSANVSGSGETLSVPVDPSGFTATAISETRIDLSWTDNADNEDEYMIERSTTQGSGYASIATIDPDVTSYSDTTGLSEGTEYFYRLKASNSVGDSGTVETSATTLDVPDAPGGLGLMVVGETRIDLSWTDNASNETGYRVERSLNESSGFSDISGNLAADSTSFIDLSLQPGVTYYYRVFAFNGDGDSEFAEGNATTLDLPADPSGFGATAASGGTIELSWTDNADNETGYRLERSLSELSGFTVIEAALAADTQTYSDGGLDTGTTYYYRLTAFNGDGDSATVSTQAITWSDREQWRFDNFGVITNTGDAADTANPDGDDGDNLAEYALGTNPNAAGDSISSRVEEDFYHDGVDEYLMIRINRDQKRADVTYRIQSSGEPGSGFSDQTVTVVTDTDTLLEVRDNTPMDTADRRFMKFDVTSP